MHLEDRKMRPLTTKLLLTYLAYAAFLTGATIPANAIENGQPDSAYVNVGAVGLDIDGPMGLPPIGICTGFVISDRAFVTAAHCIDNFEGLAQSWAVTLEPGSPDIPIIQPGILDFKLVPPNIFDFPFLVETVTATAVHKHPRFNSDTRENDVAVLVFPAGTFVVPPVQVARFGLLSWLQRLRLLERIPVGVVGYGADKDFGDFTYSIPGYRKRGFSAVGSLSRTRLVLEPTTILDANLLPGDSGSPQFVLDRVVSLNSTAVDMQRLDIPVVRRFLAPFVWR